MRNFKSYLPEKYASPAYQLVEDGIYATEDVYGFHDQVYVTSLTFEQEPEQYGEEGGCPRCISQVPFEDLLDTFCVYVTDFYAELNEKSDTLCYQEFASSRLEDIQKLRTIIGKCFRAQPYMEDGEEYYHTAIEP